jgi:amidase
MAGALPGLAQPAWSAEPQPELWSLDGGAAGGGHRGSGTGVAATVQPPELMPGLGLLLVEVTSAAGSVEAGMHGITGMDLRQAQGVALKSAVPLVTGGVAIRRAITTSPRNSVVWVDAFSNISGKALSVSAIWGGQVAPGGLKPANGWPGVLLFKRGSQSGAIIVQWGGAAQPPDLVDIRMAPAVSSYPGPDPAFVGVRHRFTLKPGQTRRLRHAVVRTDPGTKTTAADVLAQTFGLAAAPPLDGAQRDGASFINLTPGRPVSPSSAPDDGVDITRATIAGLRQGVLDGRTTVREIAELYIARMEAEDVGPDGLRSFIARNPDLLEEADALDARWRSNPDAYPLLGSIVAVKDNFAVAGLPLTLGLKGLTAPLQTDAELVARLRSLGALVSGKTNLDELASNVFGLSESGGQTLNPHARDRSPGGSSAGSAVAVASRLSTFSLGTDTCDSILQPAAQAGVAGFRPTVGLLPLSGVAPGILGHDVVGPFAPSVTDIRLLMRLVAGVTSPSPPLPLSKRRLGRLVLSPRVAGDALVDPAMTGALHRAVALGATVIDIPFAPERYLADIRDSLLLSDSRIAEQAFLKGLPGISSTSLAAIASGGDRLLAAPRGPRDYLAGSDRLQPNTSQERGAQRDATRRFKDALVALLDGYRLDALVLPVTRGAPSLIGITEAAPGVCEFSAWTGMPAISLPVGTMRGTTWPVGMLLLGRRDGDGDLLALASDVEALSGNDSRAH